MSMFFAVVIVELGVVEKDFENVDFESDKSKLNIIVKSNAITK
jgi:hypothetical protein